MNKHQKENKRLRKALQFAYFLNDCAVETLVMANKQNKWLRNQLRLDHMEQYSKEFNQKIWEVMK